MSNMARARDEFHTIKVMRLLQRIEIIAVVEEHTTIGGDKEVKETRLLLDSIERPLPVPYNEEQ